MCVMGKARFGGCTRQLHRECIKKGAPHCRWQSSGCNIRGCHTRRGGHPGYGWELTGWTLSPEEGNLPQLRRRSAGKPNLLASGEGSELGRKFLEVRERVGYELNFSSYPPFTAKIEHSSQVPLHVFLPYCTLAPC